MIERTFNDIPDGKINDADKQTFLVSLGWSRGNTWDELLDSKRVLIISEAGAGKTYECRKQSERLWADGEPAFFIELAALAAEDLRNLLDIDEEARLDAWLSSQSDIATFFLDSIDELKLTMGSFERALRKLRKSLEGQLHRVRVVVTTRPIPFDEQLVKKILPVPLASPPESNEEEFANIAMRENSKHNDSNSKDQPPDWRFVALMPLSNEQIVDFCNNQEVNDPDILFEDLQRRNALEFARRPQDLIELCADWREHKRIRTHRDQVATNIRVKLLPREDRPEPAELSVSKAIEGASRLALAVQMTRRLTIRHNAASDTIKGEAALDPAIILSDWQPNERKALLERPLFGFASYGRVRFHHRSVAEYLAAERLMTFRRKNMPFKAIRRLLFAETNGSIIVRPSKRPVVGWLALQDGGIFELLRDNEPAVLLDEGDPESLTLKQRNQALRAYAERYGPGGWRGLQVPLIQVHRFASKELAKEIDRIWHYGVENSDVREVLISIIEAGRIKACANIVFNISRDITATNVERIMAIEALVALGDERLRIISANIADADTPWPRRVSRSALLSLFPKYMSAEQLCQTLRSTKEEKRAFDDLSWRLHRLIAESPLALPVLEELRDGLLKLASEGIRWRKDWPHITSDRPHLSGALAATCERGFEITQDDHWMYSAVIALKLHHKDHYSDEPFKSLRKRLGNLNAIHNERLFWIEDSFLQSLHEENHPWKRLARVTNHYGAVQLKLDRDLTWINKALKDTTRDTNDRAMLLEAALRISTDHNSYIKHLEKLKPFIVNEPLLIQRLNEFVKASNHDKKLHQLDKKWVKRKKQEERRKAKNHASWVQFWREVANQPENAFSTEKSWHTAWNLWLAMSQDGTDGRASGWNRRFIEKQFNKEVADRLRQVLMNIWRNDHPTLASERYESHRDTILIRWQLGLAALYAEAEEPDWATKLSDTEAKLAARYAPIHRSGLPQWIADLVDTHPNAVDQTLGNELSWILRRPSDERGHSLLLQGIDHAPTNVAKLFLPRLDSWLDENSEWVPRTDNTAGITSKVRQVTQVILRHGSAAELNSLRKHALQILERQLSFELCLVWLSALIQIDPQAGIIKLSEKIEMVEPSENSDAVAWFANLFGDRKNAIRLDGELFTPQLLLQMLRLSYRHVRIQDDTQHDSYYSGGTRDDAERARNYIVTALLNAKGKEGLAAKLEMAAEPLCAHFKDRILAVAAENWALELDADVFDETQVVALEHRGEAPALTNETMFVIMKDRLSDLNDLLLRDVSPREAWAGISDERVMRREIARELSHATNSIYTVDQEAVTADEKETDIRLRSSLSRHQAVIELKLADNRTATNLLNTIENQLVKKYMAAEDSKAGALLITLSRHREWQHPIEKRKIDPEELVTLLRAEANRVQQALGGRTYIYVHLLDLRPRLDTEAKTRGTK